jgi:beta-galactosidase
MLRTLLASVLVLACTTAYVAAAQPLSAPTRHPAHTFAVEGDHFTLDGKPFKVLSGELHYSRIPREYWHARLKMAKAMGLNTIATYVFWNIHEPAPGHYDFTGQNDLAAFIKAAQQEGLYVILRSGPYSCAEWDLGGLPAWLLADPKSAQAIRTNSPLFLDPAKRWVNRLAQEVLPLQLGRGGPIIMTQIENEYGIYGSDHAYMESLRNIYLKAGFNGHDSFLYTADNWKNIPEGSIPELFAAVNFGIGNHQRGMDSLSAARPHQALFVSEYWPGWFDHWGHPHETRPSGPQIDDIDYILHRGAGINIYLFHGGTSFGFMAGSSYLNKKFLPDVTSYDYDAPLDESGRPTPKYFAYRKELAKFSACGNESCLPAVPNVPAPIAIPTINFTHTASIFDSLPNPIASALPATMEHFGQNYGYILYRTQLPQTMHGPLVIKDVHDFAAAYIDGKLVGTFDRRDAASNGSLPAVQVSTTGPARLDILVANDGRINVEHGMIGEVKGITEAVILDGRPLSNWQVYPLPMRTSPASYSMHATSHKKQIRNEDQEPSNVQPREPVKDESIEHCGFGYGNVCPNENPLHKFTASRSADATAAPAPSAAPAILRGLFTLSKPGDTFLDFSVLGKGVIWINGHNLGRFWSVGPQQTLYVPGPWLKIGQNEIVVFDMLPTAHESVQGRDHPILNAPVRDKTMDNQE